MSMMAGNPPRVQRGTGSQRAAVEPEDLSGTGLRWWWSQKRDLELQGGRDLGPR